MKEILKSALFLIGISVTAQENFIPIGQVIPPMSDPTITDTPIYTSPPSKMLPNNNSDLEKINRMVAANNHNYNLNGIISTKRQESLNAIAKLTLARFEKAEQDWKELNKVGKIRMYDTRPATKLSKPRSNIKIKSKRIRRR